MRSGLKANSRPQISRRNFAPFDMLYSVSVCGMSSGFHCRSGLLRSSTRSCVLTVSSGSKSGGIVVKTPGASCRVAAAAAVCASETSANATAITKPATERNKQRKQTRRRARRRINGRCINGLLFCSSRVAGAS
jgi:hypothetical protein